MTTYLDQLMSLDVLGDALEQGLVRRQTHPELPLAILNYTERAAYDGIWNEATLQCRGLIVDERDGTVVARPFPKFFNYGQPGAPELDLDAFACVTEKVDGSLGILYPTLDGYAVATRGSFASEQALHATDVWRDRYAGWEPSPGMTYLFEIVYPENRIVVDYAGLDDLVLLEIVHIETGESVVEQEGDPSNWPGPRVETHPYRTLAEALAAEPRPNCEGLVVSVVTGGPPVRVKIKQADYVALHRIVTGLNKRTVWEYLGAGKPIDELIAPLPDEFRPWVEDVVAELSATVAAQAREVELAYDVIVERLEWEADGSPCASCGFKHVAGDHGRSWGRKEFALLAKDSPWSWALFLRLDGRDYGPKLWRNAKPAPVGPAGRVYSEDTA